MEQLSCVLCVFLSSGNKSSQSGGVSVSTSVSKSNSSIEGDARDALFCGDFLFFANLSSLNVNTDRISKPVFNVYMPLPKLIFTFSSLKCRTLVLPVI